MFLYDESELSQRLDAITPVGRVIFALSCAERLFPTYASFSARTSQGSPERLRSFLDKLWDDVDAEQLTDAELEPLVEDAEELVPDEEDETWSELSAYAQNAVAAVAYALRCRQSGGVKDAAWAARQVHEAVDHHIVTNEDLDVNAPGVEDKILRHDLMQDALRRQDQCLSDLANAADARTVARRCRSNAVASPLMLLP